MIQHFMIIKGGPYLMRSKSRVVQLLHGVLHIIVSEELDDAGAILVNIREAHIAGFAHMVLEVLPAARRRQATDQDSVLRASRGWAATARVAHLAAATPAAVSGAASAAEVVAGAAATRKLDSQSVAIVVVTVPRMHRVLRISGREKNEPRVYYMLAFAIKLLCN
jgi:hypothetical protein